MAALKRMFTLAVQDGRVRTMPYIPTLEEDNARQGFIDHGAFMRQSAGVSARSCDFSVPVRVAVG